MAAGTTSPETLRGSESPLEEVRPETKTETRTETETEAAAETSTASTESNKDTYYVWLVINSMSNTTNTYTCFKHLEDADAHARAQFYEPENSSTSTLQLDDDTPREEELADFRGTGELGLIVEVDGEALATVAVWPIVVYQYVLDE
jgi:hypothetical protein